MAGVLSWKSVAWVVVTIILPLVFSAYGPEVRRLLEAGRRKPRQWMLTRLRYELNLLESLHNSPYNLLLHFAWNVVWVFESLLAYILLIGLVSLYKPIVRLTIPGIIIAGIFGRVLALKDTVNGLYEYDNKTAELRGRIEKIQKPN